MRFNWILMLIVLMFLLGGCSQSMTCEEPYVLVGDECVIVEPPAEVFDVMINSFTCDWSVKVGDYGVKSDCITIIANGTAQGPVGARLELPIASWSTDKFDCGAWTLKTGALVAVGSTCVREEGQPEIMGWKVVAEGCPLKGYYNNNRVYNAKIYEKGELEPKQTDRKEVVCQ